DIDAATPTKPQGQWPAQPVGSPAWVYNDTVAWVEGNNTAGRWTIGLRVPLVTGNLAGKTFPKDGIPVDDKNNFRMWYQFANIVGQDADGSYLIDPKAGAFPRDSVITGAQAADAPDNSVHIPVIADANGKTEWYDYHLRQANDPAGLCLDDGISIDPASIYILKGATKTTELTLIAPTPGNP